MSTLTYTMSNSEQNADYDMWRFHMDGAGADTFKRTGDVETATGNYVMRDNVLIGTYNHATKTVTYDLA